MSTFNIEEGYFPEPGQKCRECGEENHFFRTRLGWLMDSLVQRTNGKWVIESIEDFTEHPAGVADEPWQCGNCGSVDIDEALE